MMKSKDVAIIGAGPAGIGAALQLKRFGIEPWIFERDEIGGLLRNANLVENYPGFPDGIPGPELIALIKRQIEGKFNIIRAEIARVDFADDRFMLESDSGNFSCRHLVIATGTRPVIADGINIPESARNRVLYEIYSIANLGGKTLVIVGAGDAAFDYALNLGRYNKVVILNRGTEVKALRLLRERAEKSENITYSDNSRIVKIGIENPDGLLIEYNDGISDKLIPADYLVFAIGRRPNTGLLSADCRTKEKDLVAGGRLFYIGDVKNGGYRQTSIAVGDGVAAAMEIFDFIKGRA